MRDDETAHGGLRAVDDRMLVDELARRLDSGDENGAALMGRLTDSVGAKVAGRVVEGLESQRELDYPGDPISLLVSSSAIARRLGSVEKEPFTVAYIEDRLKPGDVFYDIGANVGPYSLIAAKATGGQAQIFAFEPSPASFRDLTRNIELNGCTDSVTPLPVALWSETRMLPVSWRSRRAGEAQHLLGAGAEDEESSSMTLAMTLDDAVESLGLPLPNHAKIDVDGGELDLLLGAQQTLASPGWRSLLIELDRTETERKRQVLELLRAAGFRAPIPQRRTGPRAHRKPGRRPRYWLFSRLAEAA